MSDRDDHDDLITNEDTRRRRAWIDRAVRGVRRRLDAGEAIPELPESEPAPTPHLRVVPGGRKN